MYPDRDILCQEHQTRVACLSNTSMRRRNISASCIWHFDTATKSRNQQIVYNRGDSVIIGGLFNDGDICGNSLKIAISKQAVGRWGTHMRLLGEY